MTALQYAVQALTLISQALSAGVEISGFVMSTQITLKEMQDEKRDPTDAEWTALNDQIDWLRGQLDKPLDAD